MHHMRAYRKKLRKLESEFRIVLVVLKIIYVMILILFLIKA
jgi:hypothetical protein